MLSLHVCLRPVCCCRGRGVGAAVAERLDTSGEAVYHLLVRASTQYFSSRAHPLVTNTALAANCIFAAALTCFCHQGSVLHAGTFMARLVVTLTHAQAVWFTGCLHDMAHRTVNTTRFQASYFARASILHCSQTARLDAVLLLSLLSCMVTLRLHLYA